MQSHSTKEDIPQLLDLLEEPTIKPSSLHIYFLGILAENISVQDPQLITKIRQELIMLDNGVESGLLSKTQRRLILQKLIGSKFQGVQPFQQASGKYFQDGINATLQGHNTVPSLCQDLDQLFIKQLLEKEEKERLKQQEMDKLTQELIKDIQLQNQKSQEKRVDEASKVEVKLNCPICCQDIKIVDLALLSCEHAFHRFCTFKHFSQCIDDRKLPLKCPECNKDAIQSDILEYLNNEYMEKFERFTFEKFVDLNNEDMSWCPTAGCQYVFSADAETYEFDCPLCHMTYCLKCKVAFHKGMTCKQFNVNRTFDKNDQQFIDFVKGAKYKQCPSCKFWVGKNQGCDHMTCRCKFEFCYVCGGVYQKCPCVVNPPQVHSLFDLIAPSLRLFPPNSPSRPQRFLD